MDEFLGGGLTKLQQKSWYHLIYSVGVANVNTLKCLMLFLQTQKGLVSYPEKLAFMRACIGILEEIQKSGKREPLEVIETLMVDESHWQQAGSYMANYYAFRHLHTGELQTEGRPVLSFIYEQIVDLLVLDGFGRNA